MKAPKVNRRRFLIGCALALPAFAAIDAFWVEPRWLKIRRIRLCEGRASLRIAHFTDVHYAGDRSYLAAVVETLNRLSPDLICFTGDLLDEQKHLEEGLRLLSGLRYPLYGVPGNHDYWSKIAFEPIADCCTRTGGAWLVDRRVVAGDGRCAITGLSSRSLSKPLPPVRAGLKNICLLHFPAWADKLRDVQYDLLLAGHSHGGQVRLPFYGAFMVPYAVEAYDRGLFHTPAGPLYVNPGIGWFPYRLRFCCRPEVTLIEI